MKNKGFTLVELLAVIVILSLLMVIAVPTSITVSEKIKQKMLNTKMELAQQNAVIWAQDNRNCFKDGATCEITCDTVDADGKKSCRLTLGVLAVENYIKYDEGTTILNPVDKTSLNDAFVCLVYNTKNKVVNVKGYQTDKTKTNCQ